VRMRGEMLHVGAEIVGAGDGTEFFFPLALGARVVGGVAEEGLVVGVRGDARCEWGDGERCCEGERGRGADEVACGDAWRIAFNVACGHGASVGLRGGILHEARGIWKLRNWDEVQILGADGCDKAAGLYSRSRIRPRIG